MAYRTTRYSVLTKCTCDTNKVNVSDYPALKVLLPEGYLYRVCTMLHLDGDRFVVRFRVNCSTKDEALAWFVKFQLASCTLFNKDRTCPENTKKNVYKVDMKCHHNTRPVRVPRRPDPRNTCCRARLGMTVRQVQLSRKYQSTDIHLHEYPMSVILHHRHNHLIDYDMEKRFLDRLKPPEIIPLLKQPEGPDMVNNLQLYIEKYNAQRQGKFAELVIHEDDFSAVLVSPLMKRMLESEPETANVLFADSTVNIGVYSCKLFLLLNTRGLPVGCILTTSDEEEVFDGALKSFKSFLNDKCFNGRGELGPSVILTDEKGSGTKSFHKAFPTTFVSMCTYRVLQSMWKFTMNDKTGIPRERRLDFFYLLQQMVNSSSKEQLTRFYENIMTCPSTSAYPKYVAYVYDIYGSRKEWAQCLKRKRNQVDQNNSWVCESAMRMVHENISKWKTVLSLKELFHCIASDIENFYENHLEAVTSCRPIQYLKRNFKAGDFSTEKVGPNSYIVRSTKGNRLFCVDTQIGLCSCMIGKFGGMCKHRILVSVKDDKNWFEPDPVERTNLYFIASEESDNFNTSHSKTQMSDENQCEEISKNLNHEDSDLDKASSSSSLDLDEMSNDELEEEMEIACDNDTLSTFTDKIHEVPLREQVEKRTNAQNGLSSIQPDVESVQKRKFTGIISTEDSWEFSSGNPVSDSPDSARIESKRNAMSKKLKVVFEDILCKMQKSDTTLQAVEDFVKNYSTLTCETSLDSALRNFGRSNNDSKS